MFYYNSVIHIAHRSVPSPPAEGACTTKVEIDLMVSFRVVAFATFWRYSCVLEAEET